MKKIILLIAISAFSLSSATYKSLTSSDKRSFVNAYKAVKSSYIDRNFSQIMNFTPEILSDYESVMFDPDCKKLRPFYEEIQQILINVRNSKKIDSIEAAAASYISSNDYGKALLLYDDAFDFLQSADSSKCSFYRLKYDSLINAISKNKTMSSYSLIASLKHVDPDFLKSYRSSIHDQFEYKIAELSASINPDSIKQFQTTYPDIHTGDVAALLERARIASRHSIMRQPTTDGYLHYKGLFGDDKILHQSIKKQAFKLSLYPNPDPNPLKEYIKLFPDEEQAIWVTFEDSLYSIWNTTKNQVKAQDYLRFYPQGRYASSFDFPQIVMPQKSTLQVMDQPR